MSDDLLPIGIKIDTSGVDRGAASLDALAAKGPKVEAATKQIEAGAKGAGKSLESLGAGAASAADPLGKVAASGAQLGPVFRDASAQMAGMGASMGLVKAAAAGFLAEFTVGKFIQLRDSFLATADSVTNLNTQLRLATGSAGAAKVAYGELLEIAQRSRVSFTELGQTYSSIARATQDLGISGDKTLRLTETLAKAITISGVSAQSANAAMIQLSQGLSSGTLRGEELNSIMEQTPRVARALAQGLGVGIGALREMGKEGKLTGDVVTEALLKASDSIDKEFGKAAVTVGQASTTLANATTDLIGKLDSVTGESSRTAQGMLKVAEAISAVSREIDALNLKQLPPQLFGSGETSNLAFGDALAQGSFLGRVASTIARRAVDTTGQTNKRNAEVDRQAVDQMESAQAYFEAASAADKAAEKAQAAVDKFVTASGNLTIVEKKNAAQVKVLNAFAESVKDFANNSEQYLKAQKALQQGLANIDKDFEKKLSPGSGGGAASKAKSDAEAYAAAIAQAEKRNKLLAAEVEARRPLTDIEKLSIELAEKEEELSRKHGVSRLAEVKAIDAETVALLAKIAARKGEAAAVESNFTAAIAIANAREASVNSLIGEAEAVEAQVKALKQETEALGLTGEALVVLTNKRTDDLIESLRVSKLREDITTRELAAIDRQITGLERLKAARFENNAKQETVDFEKRDTASILANAKKLEDEQARVAQSAADDWKKAADQINQGLTDSLFRAAEAGKGFFETLRDSIKGMFNNLVLKPLIQAGVSSLTNAAGLTSPQGGSALGSLSSLSSLGSTANQLSGLYTTIFGGASLAGLGGGITAAGGLAAGGLTAGAGAGSLLGVGGLSTAGGFTGLTAGAGAALGGGAAAGAGGLSAALAAIPVWGWGLMAATAIAAVVGQERGGPKLGGSATTGTDGARLFTPDVADAQARQVLDAILGGASGIATKFGGKFTGTASIGFDQDPQGEADSRIASVVRDATGRALLDNSTGRGVGRDAAEFDAQLQVESKRVMLAALQSSGLQNGFDEIFKRLDPATAAPEAIDSLFNLAEQLRGLGEAAKDLPGVMGDVADLSATAREQLIGFAGGLEQLAAQQSSYFAEFFSEQEQLDNASRVLTGRFAEIGLSFQALQANAAGPRQAFRALVEGLDLTTESGRQSYTALLALAGPLDQFLDGVEALPEGLSITSQALTEFADKTDDAAKAIDNSARLIEGLEGQIAGLENVFGDIRGAMADISPAADTLVDAWRRGRDEIDAIRQALGLNGGATGVTALIQRLTSGQALESTFATARSSIQDQIFEARLRGLKPEDQVSALRAQEGALWQQLGSSGDKAGVVAQIERVVLRWQSLERDIAQASAQGNSDAQYRAAVELQRLEKKARDEQITLLGKQSESWKEQLAAAERMRDFARDIGSFAQSLRIGDLSPLAPRDRIAEARSAFQRNAAGAAAGDQFAQQNLQGSASEFLTQLRQFFGSSGEFVQGFGEVQAALGGISGVNVDPQIELLNRQVSQVDAQIEYLRGIEDAAIEQQRVAVDTSAAEVAALTAIDTALAAGQNYAANEVKAVADVLRETLRISVEANAKREAEIVRLSGEIARMEAALRAIATNTAGTAQNTYDISNAVSQGEFVGPVRSPVVALT